MQCSGASVADSKLKRIMIDQTPLYCAARWWRSSEAIALSAALDASELSDEPVRSLNGKVFDVFVDAGGVWKRNAVDEGVHPVLNEHDKWTGLGKDGSVGPAYTNAEALLLVNGFTLPGVGEFTLHTLIWQPVEWWSPPQTKSEEERRVERMIAGVFPASAAVCMGPERSASVLFYRGKYLDDTGIAQLPPPAREHIRRLRCIQVLSALRICLHQRFVGGLFLLANLAKALPLSNSAVLAALQQALLSCVPTCDGCGRFGTPAQLRRCSGCQRVRYCSEACQQQGWRSGHRAKCMSAKTEVRPT